MELESELLRLVSSFSWLSCVEKFLEKDLSKFILLRTSICCECVGDYGYITKSCGIGECCSPDSAELDTESLLTVMFGSRSIDFIWSPSMEC